MNNEIFKKRCILYSYRGSKAHGLLTEETDDIDLIGVCIPPISYFFGLDKFEQFSQLPTENNKDDIVIYDIRKYFRLLLKSNPNVISLLWNDWSDYLIIDGYGYDLIESREIFNSQQAYFSFGGYAKSQLHKMVSGAYKGYMGAKRKALVEKFGYDTKNASHLIRLLKMGIEFLSTGKFIVKRTKDRDELLGIKYGERSLESIKRQAIKLFTQLDEAKSKSKLPEYPDFDSANKLLQKTLIDYLKEETI